MSAATSPGNDGLQRVCAAWGFARSSFYAMKSRQQATAERPPAKLRPSPRSSALLVAIEADLEASPWEGEGHRGLGSASKVCRGIRTALARKRVLRVMRENNLLSPHRCRRRGGNPVRSSPMPPTSCGARTAFGCSRWTTAGAGYSPPSSIGTPSASAGMCASEATASPPFSRSPWGFEAVCDLRRCGAGSRPCGWITAPSVGPLHQPDQVLGHPAVLRLRRTSPRPTASPRGSIARSRQIIHGRGYRIAELRNAVRGFVEPMPSGSWRRTAT